MTETDLVGAMPADHPLPDLGDLALALGGEMTSFTGRLLELLYKADPENRDRLRIAFPREVRAWELWLEHAPEITAGQLKDLVDDDSLTAAFMKVGEQFALLQTFRKAVLGG